MPPGEPLPDITNFGPAAAGSPPTVRGDVVTELDRACVDGHAARDVAIYRDGGRVILVRYRDVATARHIVLHLDGAEVVVERSGHGPGAEWRVRIGPGGVDPAPSAEAAAIAGWLEAPLAATGDLMARVARARSPGPPPAPAANRNRERRQGLEID